MIDYATFLEGERLVVSSSGKDVALAQLSPALFPFQRDLVLWALRKGKAAIFAYPGLGKTLMQLAWAEKAAERVLILAPLAVAQQTVREAAKFGLTATYARRMEDAPLTGITVTNYEMLAHFDPSAFGAVVLDESGILKAFEGKTRTALIEAFSETPMRLCCTATPAPNDIAEIANHAEFLGVMSRTEMLSAFFVHDDQGWRLKGHAHAAFYRWLASWGMSLTTPSELGYSDDGYILPPLAIRSVIVQTDYTPAGQLFPTTLNGITERAAVRKDTMAERVAAAVRLVQAEPDEPWLIWCGLNDEATAMAAALPGAENVQGSDSHDRKAAMLEAFAEGRLRILVSKPQVAGFGMNLQVCARMVFVGLSDSYEQYFQAIRRCYRFGQTRPVHAYVVLSEPEEPIYTNVLRKEREATATALELVQHVAEFERAEIGAPVRGRDPYEPARPLRLPAWLRSAA